MGFLLISGAHAGDVEPLQSLTFGTVAVLSNASVFSYRVRPSGRLDVDDGFIVINGGEPAAFRLSAFPPNTSIAVTAPGTTLSRNGAGISEPLDTAEFSSNSLITNELGQGVLYVGALLSTSGSGEQYNDGTYLPFNTREITLEYWSPDDGAFVTEQHPIGIQVVMQNALTLEELQPLSFGTLFARAGPTEQASITISPTGRLTKTEVDGARLVSLAKPQPGVFELLGAAPDYDINIGIPSSAVYMEIENGEAGDPRLVVTDFQSAPSGTGRTDSDGNLEIRMGATVSTDLTASTVVYPNGTYTGTYTITLSY